MQRRRAQHLQAQASVVHLGVEILRPALQTHRLQSGELAAQTGQCERPAAANVAATGEEVIKDEADPEFPGWHAGRIVEGQYEAQRPDQVRRIAQQPATFVQGFVDQVEVAVFQVAQAAVDELGRETAGAGGEVALVDQSDAQAAQHGVQRDAGAGDAAAEDEQIERSVRERLRHPSHTLSPARLVLSSKELAGNIVVKRRRSANRDLPRAMPSKTANTTLHLTGAAITVLRDRIRLQR